MDAKRAIQAIKERISIVDLARRYVDLKPNGSRFVAPCPFHQETKPSFSISPDKGFFYCFGCHESGDILDFYNKINGLEFREGLEQLAAELGISIDSWGNAGGGAESGQQLSEKRRMLRMYEAAAAHFRLNLDSPEGGAAREYVRKRGLSADIQERFGIGWASPEWRGLASALDRQGFDLALASEAGLLARSANGKIYDRFRGRLIFPIKNLSNQIIAFGGRIIDDSDEPKYINSADSPIYKKGGHLYGLAQARRGIATRGMALLTEGYMDVLTLHQFGYDNGVGVLGTALTGEQIKRISGFASRLALLFDGDRAGRKAALRSAEMLLARGLSCVVALMPEGEDIDSLLRARGKEALDSLLAKAPAGLDFCLRSLQSLAPKDAIAWARQFLADLQVPELASPYASALAQGLGVSENRLRESVAVAAGGPAPQTAMRRLLNMRDTQIMIFAVRYPERMDDLRDMGADLALDSQRSRDLWNLLAQWGAEEVIHHMDERQKQFWFRQRGPGAAPLDNGDRELACLRQELAAFYATSQKVSLSAALAENRGASDFETDLEYLRALQETLENSNEQS